MHDPNPAGADAVSAFFDAEAETWERDHGPESARAPGFRAITAYLEELISGCASSPALLDIGCATGAHLRALRPALRLGVGIDLSPRMVAAARNAATMGAGDIPTPLHFIVSDAAAVRTAIAEDETTRGLTFDLVIMIGTLEHVADRCGALASAAAILTPGSGRLVVISPHRYALPLLHHRLVRGEAKPIPLVRHFTVAGLARLAHSAGLRIERIEPIDSPGWQNTDNPPTVFARLERLRRHLPGFRGIGTFAAVMGTERDNPK